MACNRGGVTGNRNNAVPVEAFTNAVNQWPHCLLRVYTGNTFLSTSEWGLLRDWFHFNIKPATPCFYSTWWHFPESQYQKPSMVLFALDLPSFPSLYLCWLVFFCLFCFFNQKLIGKHVNIPQSLSCCLVLFNWYSISNLIKQRKAANSHVWEARNRECLIFLLIFAVCLLCTDESFHH